VGNSVAASKRGLAVAEDIVSKADARPYRAPGQQNAEACEIVVFALTGNRGRA
jgi:hypothetical protein